MRPRYSTIKHFRVCSASYEIHSTYAQHILNEVFVYAEHARKLVTRWLSMHGNWLLIGIADLEIGYSLAEHTRIVVTSWLS
jgi:hypothetical protein